MTHTARTSTTAIIGAFGRPVAQHVWEENNFIPTFSGPVRTTDEPEELWEDDCPPAMV